MASLETICWDASFAGKQNWIPNGLDGWKSHWPTQTLCEQAVHICRATEISGLICDIANQSWLIQGENMRTWENGGLVWTNTQGTSPNADLQSGWEVSANKMWVSRVRVHSPVRRFCKFPRLRHSTTPPPQFYFPDKFVVSGFTGNASLFVLASEILSGFFYEYLSCLRL